VDLDAYDILAKRAKLAGLKGKSAEAAISKALKTVSTRMSNDRNRTANRAEVLLVVKPKSVRIQTYLSKDNHCYQSKK
jgi:ElaB/YqjD/DUF883 family membrane-anchored ribosome-binding protein